MYNKNLIKGICYNAIIAALYVALVFVLTFMSYNQIQIRIAEILIFLVLVNKKYTYGILIGTFLANLIGPLGLIDAFIGTTATLFVCLFMILFKKAWTALFILPICNILIGAELAYVYNWELIPFMINTTFVMIGEFIAALIGMIIYYIFKNKKFIQVIGDF